MENKLEVTADNLIDPNEVDWEGPDDPRNPRNWTVRRRALIVGVATAIVFSTWVSWNPNIHAPVLTGQVLDFVGHSSCCAPSTRRIRRRKAGNRNASSYNRGPRTTAFLTRIADTILSSSGQRWAHSYWPRYPNCAVDVSSTMWQTWASAHSRRAAH